MVLNFDCVVVTSSNAAQCELFRKELVARKGKFFSPSCRVLALSDPLGVRVGSGGATFHAIAEAYNGGSLLVLHSGGDSRRNPLCSVSGKAFAAMNFDLTKTKCECPLDRLLEQLAKLPASNGVLIAATDTLMTNFEWQHISSKCFSKDAVTGVGIFAPWEFGTRHGVYYKRAATATDDAPFGILQKASEQALRFCGAIDSKEEVLLDSGIVHLGENVVKVLVELMSRTPFSSLTKSGIDSGVLKPVRFELYTDFLGALKDVLPREEYLSSAVSKGEEAIRKLLCEALEGISLSVLELARSSRFIHVGTTHEHRELAVSPDHYESLGLVRRCRSFVSNIEVCSETCVLINSHVSGLAGQSQIADYSLVEHSRLTGFFRIGRGAVVSNLHDVNVCVEEDMVLQQIPVDVKKLISRVGPVAAEHPYFQLALAEKKKLCVFSVFGVHDGIKDTYPAGTFGNKPWTEMEHYMRWLWPMGTAERTLWSAKLFPVVEQGNRKEEELAFWLMKRDQPISELLLNRWKSSVRISISDLVWITDVDAFQAWRYRTLPAEILKGRFVQSIANKGPYPQDALPLMVLPASDIESNATFLARELLNALDEISASFLDESLCSRALSLIADMLAGDRQPRSGDSGNPEFAPLLLALARSKPGTIQRYHAIQNLAALRESPFWSASLESLSRTARHYDAASQSLTGRCLFIESSESAHANEPIPEDVWIHATAPARIDLAGGWSDTPPITNESGGIVCNVAITLQPEVPCLGASARRFSVPGNRSTFVLRIGRFDSLPKSPAEIVTCTSPRDFDDHFNPRAPAALAKCVLLALKDLEKLMDFGGGLELCIWSDLPPGSGLGGSSILAACAALAASRVLGLMLNRQDIVKVVLNVEQLLSTGGGWQDQIGAIYPEFKISHSEAKVPIRVDVFQLPAPAVFLQEFHQRAVLVQTGPARLARDLLQNVIRRWHRRESTFTEAIDKLREAAKRMSDAIIQGNLSHVSRELNEYWTLKKFVTGEDQAEPEFIRELFRETANLTDGRSLCGAGGGGFAVFILKDKVLFEDFAKTVTDLFPEMIVHHVNVCSRGIRSWRDDIPDCDFPL